ncbi:porin family protein [Flammeovirgaceae bacterium SG7u.111]|nr:porin family protein [Flammeovirgaceae bacterium SG7u.132]WPO34027.1 porin family protein [Flammeovirgaceae bacterium SG7u.111]
MRQLKAFSILATLGLLFIGNLSKTYAQGTYLGLKGGVNFSEFKGAESDVKMTPGAAFGAFIRQESAGNFAVTGEVNYMGKGTEYKDGLLESSTVNYLEIPVLFEFMLPGERIRPRLFAGPYAGFIMGAEDNAEVGGVSVDTEENYSSIDAGAILGAGVNMKVSEENWLLLDVRYGLGMKDITTDDDLDIRNRGFNVNLGFIFPIY